MTPVWIDRLQLVLSEHDGYIQCLECLHQFLCLSMDNTQIYFSHQHSRRSTLSRLETVLHLYRAGRKASPKYSHCIVFGVYVGDTFLGQSVPHTTNLKPAAIQNSTSWLNSMEDERNWSYDPLESIPGLRVYTIVGLLLRGVESCFLCRKVMSGCWHGHGHGSSHRHRSSLTRHSSSHGHSSGLWLCHDGGLARLALALWCQVWTTELLLQVRYKTLITINQTHPP